SKWQGMGLVRPSLSPMSIGPIDHGQPGLPPSLNLENFHQGNKKFPCETVEQFLETRLALYQSPFPQRHKFKGVGNIPEFSVWIDKNGVQWQIDYITSRQFYCNFYERFVSIHQDFQELRSLLEQGYDLVICGPDAHSMNDVNEAYLNPVNPFGHERVL